jgi:hypothetical protein
MTKARDLSNLISTGVPNSLITLDANEIPNIDAGKITSGTFADARIASSNVSQHATSFDDNKIVNDISTLALRQASNENKAAYNTNSMYVDVFQDDTGIASNTNAPRNSGEFVSTVVPSGWSVDTNTALNTSLVAHYKWDNSDDDLKDLNELTAEGTPTYSSSVKKLGTHSVYFDNNADAFAFTSGSPSWGALTNISMATWVYWQGASGGYEMIFDGYGDSSNQSVNFGIQDSDDTPQIYTKDGSWGTSTSTVAKNTWVHLGFSVSASYKKFYINGALTNTVSGSFQVGAGYSHNRIGARNNDTHGFDGYLDQTLFWLKDISAQEMTDLYNSGSGNEYIVGYTNATGNFISNAITAPSSTNKMGAIITYQDNAGTNTLNTDIVLQLSADNGSNFTTATLTAMPDFASGIKMAKVNDLSVTAGTQLKYKISFANQASGSKEARIRGVSLQY